ncbi:MAG TPA: hypothetical protein PKE64_14515 [Anaerolineae bacterium]|nr:hypothetical protein [Anaerolineae bacterium]
MSNRANPQRKTQLTEKKASQPHKTDAQSTSPLALQRAVLQPEQARPQDILKLQQNYGSQAVSSLMQAQLKGTTPPHAAKQLVQRSKDDDKPDALPKALEPDVFKDRTTKATWQREGYHRTIIAWLRAAKRAQTQAAQQDALNHVAEACDAWLGKFGAEEKPKEASSTTGRRPHIHYLRQLVATRTSATPTGTSVGTGEAAGTKQQASTDSTVAKETPEQSSAAEEGSNEGTDALGGFSDIVGSGSGITGAYGDRNVKVAPDTYEGDYMDQGGSGKLNRAEFDMGEGANILGGGLKMFSAGKKLKEGEYLEAGKEGIEGYGQAVHGGMKFSKGVALKLGEDSTKWTQVGDIGAAFADGATLISGLISTWQGLKGDAVTGSEKIDKRLDTTANVVNTARAGVNTSLDILKVVTKVGQEGGKTQIANLATASGALGIVSGTIEMIQGGIKVYRGFTSTQDLAAAQGEQKKLLGEVFTRLTQLPGHLALLSTSTDEVGKSKVGPELDKLKAAYDQLHAAHQKYAPAMAAMEKIQSRRMEEGMFKMAKGATAVVSGALLVSGVGAPIGVAVAALAGIMALGQAGLAWRRNAAADRLTTTALRLPDEGQPKVRPDPQMPEYRTMEKRIYKCYYTHLPQVIQGQTPPGLTGDQFLDVKRFTWPEKLERTGNYKMTITYDKAADIPTSDNDQVRNNWLGLKDEKGKIKKEAPTGTSYAKLKLTASAHKSKQSLEASKTEVVDALYTLGSQSWKPVEGPVTKTGKPAGIGSFVEAPIVPIGDADPETLKQYGQITLQALLKAANITPALWQRWLDQSGGDEKKMKELIGSKLG